MPREPPLLTVPLVIVIAPDGFVGSPTATGNVHFSNMNITSTNGKMDYYFDFFDGSGHGLVNESFTNPGTLSGGNLTNASCNGLVSGACAATVP